MDDIVIYARSLKEHEIKFNKLMQRLRTANLKLQPDKCEFLRHEVAYLGHIIGADGVKPDPNKIKSITEFPRPKNVKNIKQFLGLAGYYRRFIPQFSKTAKPLTDLLKKNNTFDWQQRQTEAFNVLRFSLCSEPVLQYPDFSKPFILTTDASGYAIGGVLSQGQIGKDLPIAYTSRVLNSAEQNYSTIEKECLAIVYCTNHFRPYLYGRIFTIITDHKPLVWLHSIKDPSSRLWKWKTKLAEYEYVIQYKKGSLNNNADALSRNPPTDYVLPLTFAANRVGESSNNATSHYECEPSTSAPNNDIIDPPTEFAPPSPPPGRTNVTIEEYSSDDEFNDDDRTSIDLEEINNQYEEILDLNEERRNTDQILITESRDSLLKQSDNHVIFIHVNGTPFDNGAKEYQEANLLPNYENLTFERVNIKTIKSRTLISIPIRLNNHSRLEPQTLKNCIRSLLDALTELELTTFSISKTDYFDDLPWQHIIGQIHEYLRELPICITICKNLVQTPPVERREALIIENHSSAHGGHKGVAKTYNRLRPHYYWNTMKKDIQTFIQKCRQCQLKKLTRIKTKQPMVITDTPGAAFDKVSLDIVGPLPITNSGNQYILTMQDLLTKYSVAVPLRDATSLSIANALTNNFICVYGAPKAILTDQGSKRKRLG
ncbi:enzymatic polyprotein endonuclease reverse [Lasius niger]|uniref:RNA-directed DNA polymerase n=1 Tax=Lasius niger TaxID=67767 RepID=A0A0J7KH94_LASNI|nr:enzymatic polyprotein endonuclease reverse [Lasius niger]